MWACGGFCGVVAVVTVGFVTGLAGLFVGRKLAGKWDFYRRVKNWVYLRM